MIFKKNCGNSLASNTKKKIHCKNPKKKKMNENLLSSPKFKFILEKKLKKSINYKFISLLKKMIK